MLLKNGMKWDILCILPFYRLLNIFIYIFYAFLWPNFGGLGGLGDEDIDFVNVYFAHVRVCCLDRVETHSRAPLDLVNLSDYLP